MSKIYTFKSNIKKKSPFNKTVVAIALAVSFIAGGSGGYYLYNHKFANETKEQSSGSTEPESETNKPNYIGETAFDGSEEVDNRLFEYAYPSESEGYTNNKKLYEELGDYKMRAISDRADAIGTELFSFDYRKVRTDYDTYYNTLSSMFRDVVYDDDTDQDVVLSEMIADFSDVELQMTADYKTSKFMIYQNGMPMYVRGILTVYIWSCKDIEKVSKYFPTTLKVGEDNTFVYEMEILNSMDSHKAEKMQIFDYYDCKFLDIL
ncbi:hypothetical protein [Butyrivibrio sp. M55]|uniref:hypothetical protein n=1 Tax=Butyrivibrio sp. M55 TaxID=1855323 RepID=UPI0008F01DF1|nr:hypothetical protein [Butyrivibrio sp. M55]SFU90989.1 hypothetical protein SAMN05216540_12027 [Butyrivibrio sp. M55]